MPLSPVTRLGPYEILSVIGAGGMGEVYKARDTRLNRNVAVKILPASLAGETDRLRRFTLEAQSASSLNHPNILAIYDIGTHEGSLYIVSELLEGETLGGRLKNGKLGVGKSVDYARQIANGLAAAHAKDITHRDIKPENIFITGDGQAKILDFGLAKMKADVPDENGITGTATATEAGVVMGTVGYMAPEQVRGQAADARADIFSFGVVLFEMLSGRRAFQRDTAAETMAAILKEDPPEISTPESPLPPALERLVRHCLEKSPEERFQSARDIAFDLEGVTQPPGKMQPGPEKAPGKNRTGWALAGVMTLCLASALYFYFRPVPAKAFHRLTFRRGWIHAARFTPDGNGVIYSSQWEDEPSEIFTARLDSPGSRALGLSGMELRAVSISGELALAQKSRVAGLPFAPIGMLARVPLSGSAPRPVEDNISFADWSPDGKELAVVRETDQGAQLEYPLGKILYRSTGFVSQPRIAPDGNRVAFMDHRLPNDNRGGVAIVDRAGNKKTLTAEYLATEGLAWSARGDEVWFSAAQTGSRFDLRAATLAGRERVVYSAPVSIVLQDVFRDGRVLVTTVEQRCKMMFRGAAESIERDLSWLDWSLLSSLSQDGKLLTFFESGEGAGDTTLAYLRETNGSAAVLLGTGAFPILSPDGQSVVTWDPAAAAITIYPVGPGQARRIPLPGFTLSFAGLLADGKGLWFNGSEPSHGIRYHLIGLEGSKPRALTPEGVRSSNPGLVLNGKYVAGISGGRTVLYPVDGGEPRPLAGVSDRERIAGWSDDGQALFIYTRNNVPAKVERVDLGSGKRELVKEITPSDRAGLAGGVNSLRITSDGRGYAYSYIQQLSELQLVEGLR
jgi:hypothetical protein